MSWNRKSSRVFHAAVGLWCGGLLLTACGGSPEELRDGFQQPDEAQLIQQTAALGGAQPYTARSQNYDDLLAHRTGFALDANVVGAGADAQVYIVDKTTDDDNTPGTLRHALESPQPYWIRFAPALAGQSITVKSSIFVQSHKTIDGRLNYAQPVRIKTNASSTHVVKALVFDGKTQLIVMNVNFDDGYDGWKQDAEGSEAIHIANSTHIWLHQNRFARFRDVAVEMDLPLSDLVTMTYNLFERQYQAVVLRSQRADFHHNRCLNSGARCPRMGGPDTGGGNLYVYNNLIEFWEEESIHFAAKLGQFLAVENVYNPRTDTLRLAGACGGTSDTWKKTANLMVGKADVGACIENREPHVERAAATVNFFTSCPATPPIPASVNLEPASDALADSLRNNARPQAYVVDSSCR